MAESPVVRLDGVPDHVETVLSDFVAELKETCADDLVSVVLFGSGAEGKLTAGLNASWRGSCRTQRSAVSSWPIPA